MYISKKILIAILIIIIAGVSLFFIKQNRDKNEQPVYPEDEAVEQENLFEDIAEEEVLKTNSNNLEDFIKTDIEPRCPFYEPNGVEYKQCLSQWIDELLFNQKIIVGSDEYKEFFIECREYAMTQGEERYSVYGVALSNCLIFELSK